MKRFRIYASTDDKGVGMEFVWDEASFLQLNGFRFEPYQIKQLLEYDILSIFNSNYFILAQQIKD